MNRILLIAFLTCSLAARAQDTIAPKFLYSVTYIYLNTSRDYKTHVQKRESALDFNADETSRGHGMGIGVNIYYIFSPKIKLETGLLYTTNQYHAVQRGIFRTDTVQSMPVVVKFDDLRDYHMDRLSIPVKLHYNLQKKSYAWFVTAGFFASRIYTESVESYACYGEFGGKSKVNVFDIFGNQINYTRYQVDYNAGFGKLIKLSPELGLKLEAGYNRSAFSVLKNSDKGYLSAIYGQIGLFAW
jgi:hypothetical protein